MKSFAKPTKIRSKKIRQSAEGEQCALRTPACNHDPATVVLCHAPGGGSGVATKGDDTWAAYGCSSCHEWTEQNRNKANEYWMPAIYETQKKLIRKGLIQVS